jgi:hypothetical protein
VLEQGSCLFLRDVVLGSIVSLEVTSAREGSHIVINLHLSVPSYGIHINCGTSHVDSLSFYNSDLLLMSIISVGLTHALNGTIQIFDTRGFM